MLMLTRYDNQTLTIFCPDGQEIRVLYKHLEGGRRQGKIGIDAPVNYFIERDEINRKRNLSHDDDI